MNQYLLHSVSKTAANAQMVSAGLGYMSIITPTVFIANTGYNIGSLGPEMIITDELDAEGAQMWAEVPDTWRTIIQSEVELSETILAALLPGTITEYAGRAA